MKQQDWDIPEIPPDAEWNRGPDCPYCLLFGHHTPVSPDKVCALGHDTATPLRHRSADGFEVKVGGKFWSNDLRVVQIEKVAVSMNAYSDTGELQTWHSTNESIFDTLTNTMQRIGRLTRYFGGKDAECYPVGTNYGDVKTR